MMNISQHDRKLRPRGAEEQGAGQEGCGGRLVSEEPWWPLGAADGGPWAGFSVSRDAKRVLRPGLRGAKNMRSQSAPNF